MSPSAPDPGPLPDYDPRNSDRARVNPLKAEPSSLAELASKVAQLELMVQRLVEEGRITRQMVEGATITTTCTGTSIQSIWRPGTNAPAAT